MRDDAPGPGGSELSAGLGGCCHKHTGSCSPNGVYLYVRCMDCWELLATSKEADRRLDACPGYEPPKRDYGRNCVHCGFDWWDHQPTPNVSHERAACRPLDAAG